MTPLLSARGLHKRWRQGWWRPVETVGLGGVDLELLPGEVVGLIGESGSGKTTLARTALGLSALDAGSVSINGIDPHKNRKLIPPVAQLLFQDAGASLNPGLTVQAILEESARHFPGTDSVQIVLERLDLLPRAHARPSELSGGERRRVTLGQVWLANPLLLVADEPTAGLDASRKGEIIDLLLSRRSPERGFLLISHDLPLVLYACQRLLVMQAGRIIDDFPTPELFAPQRHPWTQKLCINAGLEPPCS